MDTNSRLSNNTAVILVSHGSTLPYAEKVFGEIKEKFIKKSGLATEIGYMKVSEPAITEAVKIVLRSEERRVGKECRSRWSPYH